MSFVAGDIFGGGSPNYANVAQQQQAQYQSEIAQGTSAISQAYAGFNPQFYQNYEQAYQDYAQPQLAQQFVSTRNDIGFDMANRGLTGGSASQTAFGNFNNAMSTAQENIVDTSISQAQQLQQNVQSSENQQLQALYSSADPAQAGQQATQTAAGFASTPVFTPIANQFTNLLNQYYTSQLINSYAPTSYVQVPQYSSPGVGQSAVGGGQ